MFLGRNQTPWWALLLLLSIPAAAQTGRLSGSVQDPDGGPLPGVRVEAAGPATQYAVTDAQGSWRIENLGAGTYQVSFRLLNFASVLKKDIVVQDGAEATVNAVLPLSASADIVVTGQRTFKDLAELEDRDGLVGIADAATEGIITPREIAARPARRAADLLETVPGVIISQHSGEGKANQYYLRGFNLDHGTDLAIWVDGLPVNMPTHGHGQGYADLNYLIPELVSGVQYKKGPYFAEEGDFSAAGAAHIRYANVLEKSIGRLEGGELGYRRAMAAVSPTLGSGHLLAAFEILGNDGPWDRPDDYRRLNGVLRYSQGDTRNGFSITAMGYDAEWDSTDQIPLRAVQNGSISRFGLIDDTDGGETHRYSLAGDWQRSSDKAVSRVNLYAIDYKMNLWSNFTYFLDDPENGDQFEQADDRFIFGLRASHQWISKLGGLDLENLVGIQARNDSISTVGLYHTAARQRLSTTREDDVLQTSGALYAQSILSPSQTFRVIAGLRADLYRFDVESDLAANSGDDTASLVSPKLGVILGPFSKTEFYGNAGSSFHSNDARGSTITVDPGTGDPAEKVDPLVRAKGAEIGLRTTALPNAHATLALWGLDIDSELLFIGDAGNTEASRPSRRTGLEANLLWKPQPWLAFDADLALSRSRFRDEDPAGDFIPGSVQTVLAVGASVEDLKNFTGGVQLRYFGPRALLEDDSIRSEASTLVNARIRYELLERYQISLDVLNVLDEESSDIDYFYESRLPGEPDEGVSDFHTHPVEPRSARVSISALF